MASVCKKVRLCITVTGEKYREHGEIYHKIYHQRFGKNKLVGTQSAAPEPVKPLLTHQLFHSGQAQQFAGFVDIDHFEAGFAESGGDSSPAHKSALSALAVPYLPQVQDGEFVFGGKKPLSYTQVRKMCDRIKKDISFSENITPIRFRTTVLTDLYDQTKDIKLAQAAAEHTTSAMTLRYYVKGRETINKAAAVVDRTYSA